jgi:4-amino-4-deoxy-L-arabinose transferase-like glycosyltransferase
MRDNYLFLILLLYLGLALGYGIINPVFEAPDEHHHYFTVRQIVETGRLPVADGTENLARQEAAQPPLYYLLGAGLIAGIETITAAPPLWFNPYVQLGAASAGNNPNAFIHTPQEDWPWQGHILAVHVLRIFAAVLGLGTLWGIYGMACLLWPDEPRRGWVATAVIAFLPQFNFLHSAVSNDPLIILLCTLALWQMMAIYQHDDNRKRFVWLGVTIGLAILAKTAGLLLLVLVGGMMVWRYGRSPRQLLTNLSLILIPVILIAGWLLWRNWLLYGDVTAANRFIELAGGNRHYTIAQVLADLDRVALSAIAFFGWMTVQPPSWV